jgi:hypothetical protein
MPIPLPSSGALATRSYRRVIYLVVAALLAAVLLAPLRVVGVIVLRAPAGDGGYGRA